MNEMDGRTVVIVSKQFHLILTDPNFETLPSQVLHHLIVCCSHYKSEILNQKIDFVLFFIHTNNPQSYHFFCLEAERKAEEQRQAQLRRMREQEARWRQIAPPILGEITVPGSGSGFVVDPVRLLSLTYTSSLRLVCV
jgi:hypothetical protein